MAHEDLFGSVNRCLWQCKLKQQHFPKGSNVCLCGGINSCIDSITFWCSATTLGIIRVYFWCSDTYDNIGIHIWCSETPHITTIHFCCSGTPSTTSIHFWTSTRGPQDRSFCSIFDPVQKESSTENSDKTSYCTNDLWWSCMIPILNEQSQRSKDDFKTLRYSTKKITFLY